MSTLRIWVRVWSKEKAGGAFAEARVGKDRRDMATKGRKPMKEDQVVWCGIQGPFPHCVLRDHPFPCTNLLWHPYYRPIFQGWKYGICRRRYQMLHLVWRGAKDKGRAAKLHVLWYETKPFFFLVPVLSVPCSSISNHRLASVVTALVIVYQEPCKLPQVEV